MGGKLKMFNHYGNIISMSARDYCESQGKSLCDYIIEGIHAEGRTPWGVMWEFEKKAFDGHPVHKAEVITDLRVMKTGIFHGYYGCGLTLIPKSRKE